MRDSIRPIDLRREERRLIKAMLEINKRVEEVRVDRADGLFSDVLTSTRPRLLKNLVLSCGGPNGCICVRCSIVPAIESCAR